MFKLLPRNPRFLPPVLRTLSNHSYSTKITPRQTSGSNAEEAKSTHTGSINRDEDSIYSSEATRSGTHHEIVHQAPHAAFDPTITDPENAKQSAGNEVCKEIVPLTLKKDLSFHLLTDLWGSLRSMTLETLWITRVPPLRSVK